TTDNESNIVKAVELNKWLRMQCFGHRLHLTIGHGMNDKRVTRAISLCKRIVSIFSYSWKKRRHLAGIQIQMGLPSHQLITESATRWESRQQMIERVLEQERALSKVLSEDKKTRYLVPTRQDLEVLEAVQKVLKPLQDFTDASSAEKYVTLSYVKPVLHLFNESLLACEEGDSDLCKSIKTNIAEYLNRKFSDPDTTDLLDMASFVDPRFRATYIPREKVDALKHGAVLEVDTLLADQSSCQPHYQRVPTVPEPADGDAAVAPKAKTLASFFKQLTPTTTAAPNKRGAIENELSSYLQSASVESDTDPLKWWKDHEVVFPGLSRLAKKYLLVPATSSPSERVFSCSGNIVTCHRASLKPDTVDRLVFL
uniref:HAT C-terminal dimerisation domain-containing protein n=2 Tax=Gasterosteus aculeatus TaxID=69293 RepID=G3N6T0_GASAC